MKDNGMPDASDLDMKALDRAERDERHNPPPTPSEPLWRELLAAANEHLVAWLPEDESRTRHRLSAAMDALTRPATGGEG